MLPWLLLLPSGLLLHVPNSQLMSVGSLDVRSLVWTVLFKNCQHFLIGWLDTHKKLESGFSWKMKVWQYRVLYYHKVKSSRRWFKATVSTLCSTYFVTCLIPAVIWVCCPCSRQPDWLLELYSRSGHCSVLTLGSRMRKYWSWQRGLGATDH